MQLHACRVLISICAFAFVVSDLESTHFDCASIVYDAAADFSISGNPNVSWSYGYSSTLGGTFNPYTVSNSTFIGNSNFDGWTTTATTFTDTPFAAKNTSASIEQAIGLRLPPGGLGLHPGPDIGNQFSIIRWSAPSAGFYEVNAAFTDRDFSDLSFGRGATTDVHVLQNNATLYDAIVNKDGWGLGPTGYSSVLLLSLGDTIDFVVGRGQNNTHLSDSTGLAATISAVPEGSALLLLSGSLMPCALAAAGRRLLVGRR
jgi:hypothetical protein